jgi:cytochrome c oxidase cbb3-type subunit III
MKRVAYIFVLASLAASLSGCESLPGKPAPGPEVPRPDAVLDAATLYRENCAGCHGKTGVEGIAPPIGLPEYQAWADEATQRKVVGDGLPRTSMPGFSRKAGGLLTDQQIDTLVKGMGAMWSKGNIFAGQTPPPYADATPGDSAAGASVYDASCSRCHGKVSGAVGPAGSVLNASLLALVSAQAIRTEVVLGRPNLQVPDWRHANADHALSDKEVRDVVAFLVSHQTPNPGQPYSGKSAESAEGGTR